MQTSMRYRWAALTLIVAAALLRSSYLAFWSPFDLAPDEAHYWDWSRQLDWCYYSKGPLVAWLIRASCAIFGDTMLAVRLPAVVCGSLLLAGLFTLTVQVTQDDRLAFGMVALALTLPIVAAGSSLMTIDAPFLCAWMWALVFAYQAVIRAATWAWPSAGVCILLGVLAKHSMVLFVPSFGLFLLTTPLLRPLLLQSGFWSMTAIGAVGGVPILVWNARNDWVTFKHAQSHAGLESEAMLHWVGPFKYLGGQLALLLGFWFLLWVLVIWMHRPTRESRLEFRFLWWMSLPTFVWFGVFSLKNGGGEPNWPLAAYLSGGVLVAAMHGSQSWLKVGGALTAALGLLVTLAIHEPIRMQPVLLRLAGPATSERPTPIRRVDPTCRLRGWRFLAEHVDHTRTELRQRGIEPVLATERWTQAGELAFYCDGQPQVHSLGLLFGDRHCQYDLWRPNPCADRSAFEGRSFIFAGVSSHVLRDVFDEVETPRWVQYRENGHVIAEWCIVVAHGYRGRNGAPSRSSY
jgi:hypothetical protein